jgi:hypothetical protein
MSGRAYTLTPDNAHAVKALVTKVISAPYLLLAREHSISFWKKAPDLQYDKLGLYSEDCLVPATCMYKKTDEELEGILWANRDSLIAEGGDDCVFRHAHEVVVNKVYGRDCTFLMTRFGRARRALGAYPARSEQWECEWVYKHLVHSASTTQVLLGNAVEGPCSGAARILIPRRQLLASLRLVGSL